MSDFDQAWARAESLRPADRLRLIQRLQESVPGENAAPDDSATAPIPPELLEQYLKESLHARHSTYSKVYSAPRRFDLATIFVVTAAYSLLLGAMSPLRSPTASILVAGFITLVGISQAVLFKGRQPRMASVLVGVTLYSITMLGYWLLSGPRLMPNAVLLIAGTYTIVAGAILGYLAGACVGGVFLLADVLRGRFGRQPSGNALE